MCAAFPAAAADLEAYWWAIAELQAHHVVPQQRLRRAGLHALLLDERMGLCLCAWHHQRHTNRRQPVPTALLPAETVDLVEEIGFGWMLNNPREYP